MRQVRAITAPDVHVQQWYHYVRYFFIIHHTQGLASSLFYMLHSLS